MTLITQAEFARRMGWNRSSVNRGAKTGRIVLVGKLVDLEASEAQLRATGGERPDVAERFASERAASAASPASASASGSSSASSSLGAGDTPSKPEAEDRVGNSYQAARAVKEKYGALKAKADYEQQIAHLIPREDVDAALRFLGAALRSAMDVFPDQTAPVVAPVTDLNEIHSLLSEACRNVLANIDDAIARQQAALTAGGGA